MNRLTILAHYDAQGEVKPYILHHLRALRPLCRKLVFASSARLPGAELDRAREYVDEVRAVQNVGFDFGMWRDVLLSTDLSSLDEVCVTNSSVFGPVFPLAPIFDRLTSDPCHFWGMTDNLEYRWHLQSYFLVFKRPVLSSDAFRRFWESVLPYKEKSQTIFSYEIGLTQFLLERDCQPRAFVATESWASPLRRRWMGVRDRWNPSINYPLQLLARGCPYVKVELLRDNPGHVDVARVLDVMTRAGYDTRMVQFDR